MRTTSCNTIQETVTMGGYTVSKEWADLFTGSELNARRALTASLWEAVTLIKMAHQEEALQRSGFIMAKYPGIQPDYQLEISDFV